MASFAGPSLLTSGVGIPPTSLGAWLGWMPWGQGRLLILSVYFSILWKVCPQWGICIVPLAAVHTFLRDMFTFGNLFCVFWWSQGHAHAYPALQNGVSGLKTQKVPSLQAFWWFRDYLSLSYVMMTLWASIPFTSIRLAGMTLSLRGVISLFRFPLGHRTERRSYNAHSQKCLGRGFFVLAP